MVKLAIFLPLASSFSLFLFAPLLKKKEAAWLGCLAPLISFLTLLSAPLGDLFIYSFLSDAGISFSLHLDPLSYVYGLVITGVGFLIHLFSVGYMEHEDAAPFARYFAQMNLFNFSMLLLVLSGNLLFLFFGWELVGLCSYLLIGFWKQREAPAMAARKAFLTNRFGDIFFLAGLLLTYASVHSFSFQALFSASLSFDLKTIIGLLLFIGATGKSAQFPLYIWLPDAMEGPTPVSALIHAATMVTAGVYLVLRLFPLLDGTETMALIAYGGGLTALYAALVASFQVELKKVLAFSTISQLGLMFIALGCGGYLFALFHFVTHAFFKSLLFLGAGAIMHSCAGEQNIFKLGGLAKKMPFVHAVFLCGALALAGIFPFSGFFSKDGILAVAFQKSFPLYVVAQGASFLTAFYTFRMLFYTFYGEYKGKGYPHDPSWVMLLPLSLLGFLSLFGGLLQPPLSFHPLASLLQSVLPLPEHVGGLLVPVLSLLFGIAGIAIAYIQFQRKGELASPFLAGDKLQTLVYEPLYRLGESLATGFWLIADLLTIDGIVNGTGALVMGIGGKLRKIVSGELQPYLITISLTMALLLSLLRFYGR